MTLDKLTGPEKQPTSMKILEKPVENPRILRGEVMASNEIQKGMPRMLWSF